ncbi:MAG: hypothetical protein JO290_08550, partial [Sphingomonadaceae bacterium]|nr:hypothetical protein [Sphingomonadaceae bacterium]
MGGIGKSETRLVLARDRAGFRGDGRLYALLELGDRRIIDRVLASDRIDLRLPRGPRLRVVLLALLQPVEPRGIVEHAG